MSEIEKLENPTFDKVRDLAKRYHDSFENKHCSEDLDRGIKVLSTIEECAAYLALYDHKSNLYSSYEYVDASVFTESVDLIDWGCGQGVATMHLSEYIGQNNINIKTVTLVDISEIALSQAQKYVAKFLPKATIYQILVKSFEELVPKQFSHCINKTQMHIFANIIDIQTVNVNALYDFLTTIKRCNNYYVAVSPAYHKNAKEICWREECVGDCQMNNFATLFGTKLIKCDVKEMKKGGLQLFVTHKPHQLLDEELSCYIDCYGQIPIIGYPMDCLGEIDLSVKGCKRYKLDFFGERINAICDIDISENSIECLLLLGYRCFGLYSGHYYRIMRRSN